MTQRRNSNPSSLSVHAEKVLAYLEQVYRRQLDAERLQRSIELMSDQAVSVPSASAAHDIKIQSLRSEEAPFISSVSEKDQMERELRELTEELEPLKSQALQIIRQQTGLLQRIVLTWHFIHGFPWKAVAMRVDRTERQVYRLRNEGLEMIVLPEDAIWLE